MTNALDSRADWSGYSPPVSSKRHILPPDGDDAKEFVWKPGRRVDKSCNCNVSSPSLLGGPVPARNPSVVGSRSWQTEAQAASDQTKTSREQLTESGRSMFVRGKHSTVPAYENPRPYDASVGARLRDECDNLFDGKSKAENKNPIIDPGYFLVGYRSVGRARSFLEGLGTEVASVMSTSTD